MHRFCAAILIGSTLLCSGFIFSEQRIKTYEDAWDQAYSLFTKDHPHEAIKIIRLISDQNIPVREEDVFYVRSLAALAARPIFRELTLAIKLLKAIYEVKKDDYATNLMLFAFALDKQNEAEVIEFAKALIHSDYRAYLKEMEPAKMSSIEEIRNYHDRMIKTYEYIASLFRGVDDALEKKAKEIVATLKAHNPQ